MYPRKYAENFSIFEALLPLFFFQGNDLFYAALLIPVVSGVTLFVFELLRSQPRPALFAIYLVWLSVCGALGWFTLDLPPYWIWPVHLLIPKTAWAPSDAQRARPFLFGLKKYMKRRVMELVVALIAAFAVAGGILFLQQKTGGVMLWIFGALALVVMEVILGQLQRLKK